MRNYIVRYFSKGNYKKYNLHNYRNENEGGCQGHRWKIVKMTEFEFHLPVWI
jgi:hypothetical protein